MWGRQIKMRSRPRRVHSASLGEQSQAIRCQHWENSDEGNWDHLTDWMLAQHTLGGHSSVVLPCSICFYFMDRLCTWNSLVDLFCPEGDDTGSVEWVKIVVLEAPNFMGIPSSNVHIRGGASMRCWAVPAMGTTGRASALAKEEENAGAQLSPPRPASVLLQMEPFWMLGAW